MTDIYVDFTMFKWIKWDQSTDAPIDAGDLKLTDTILVEDSKTKKILTFVDPNNIHWDKVERYAMFRLIDIKKRKNIISIDKSESRTGSIKLRKGL